MREFYGIIYSATNGVNGKKYVGQTTSTLDQRRYNHEISTKSGHFYKAIKKYGKENFEWKIEKFCINKEDLNNSEIQLIKEYHTKDSNFGYNLTIGGEGTKGIVVRPETRLKLREINLGKKYSRETIEKKIATRKATDKKNGYHNSPEAIAKMKKIRIAREIRECKCGCGYKKEVRINSTWRYKHGHNSITAESKRKALRPKYVGWGTDMKDPTIVDKQLAARGLKRVPLETRVCKCTPDCKETFICKASKKQKYKNNAHRFTAARNEKK